MADTPKKGSEKLTVMNGSSQYSQHDGKEWVTLKVTSDAGMPHGVFMLDSAKKISLDDSSTFTGVVLHSSNRAVFQKVDNKIVRHSGLTFKELPQPGQEISITYDRGHATVKKAVQTQLLKRTQKQSR